MKYLLKPAVALVLASLLGSRASAADMTIKVDIPRLDTAEYHRPYVAIWLEDAGKKDIRDIAVWYEHEKPQEEGKKWLKDLRQWWRLSGRNQEKPADGVSGATRAVGVQTVNLSGQSPALSGLEPGDYQVVVEAAREKGGRELLRLPLAWPPAQSLTINAQGQQELGPVSLTLTP
ncbi:Hypothetical protein SAMN04488135_103147 [Pollutimonas bauzanensis]|uniref:DUF2271 domain-containing protein n=1 Tax=Pollutimonas bauzanensis TaxID=658167 RepID=A0A1M5SQB8_9BURK|nr:Hypothetical protein SAMN04488135_103147 [Pollutimonas bauzanensis]